MQTIIGAGGAVGVALAKELIQYTDQIRLVSRNPQKVNETDELFACDAKSRNKVFEAVKGSEIVYVTIGFKYDTKEWQTRWPLFIRCVISACMYYKAKLVFLDNVYMYDPDCFSNLTEDSKVNPTALKGIVRSKVAQRVVDAYTSGNLDAVIVRAADFLGNTPNSLFYSLMFKKLHKGKAASWLANGNKKHNASFVPDIARAMAKVGNTPEAYNQIWHAPSLHEQLTAKEWANEIADTLNVKAKFSVLSKPMIKLLGYFVPALKEVYETIYQYDRDYFVNSTKYEKAFNDQPTPLKVALKTMAKEYN